MLKRLNLSDIELINQELSIYCSSKNSIKENDSTSAGKLDIRKQSNSGRSLKRRRSESRQNVENQPRRSENLNKNSTKLNSNESTSANLLDFCRQSNSGGALKRRRSELRENVGNQPRRSERIKKLSERLLESHGKPFDNHLKKTIKHENTSNVRMILKPTKSAASKASKQQSNEANMTDHTIASTIGILSELDFCSSINKSNSNVFDNSVNEEPNVRTKNQRSLNRPIVSNHNKQQNKNEKISDAQPKNSNQHPDDIIRKSKSNDKSLIRIQLRRSSKIDAIGPQKKEPIKVKTAQACG